ncbi:hypothetical protein KGQ34_02620, partial [Patescibacteria group bacterium]|nr:hypothetical protein [Patescibacteria group bacterium]
NDYLGINERMIIVDTVEKGFTSHEKTDILLGVKEILLEEYNILRSVRPGTVIACFWHVMSPEAKQIIEERNLEPVWLESMPGLLKAMSSITGTMSVDVACHYLRKNVLGGKFVGRGVMPENATLAILGAAGNLGQAVYRAAHHRFAKIIALEIKKVMQQPYQMAYESREWREATPENILQSLLESDAVISGVHIPGKENPKPITKDMIVAWGKAKPQAVFVDPAIDQGGSSETSTPTTHQNPVYLSENILHYCVANMPGAIPQTSTPALEQALLPNLVELIKKTARKEGMGY